MPEYHDGPASPLFSPLPIKGNVTFAGLASGPVSKRMKDHADRAPSGKCTCWGMPFGVGRPLLLIDKPVARTFTPVKARWLVFMHTTDVVELKGNKDGFISPTHGHGRLGEHIADYVICYADGSEVRQAIRRRHQISMFQRPWGEGCFEAVGYRKPHPVRQLHEQPASGGRSENPVGWGWSQTRVQMEDSLLWTNWLWAWENPDPGKPIAGIRFEPKGQAIVVLGVSAGNARSMPLRWEPRRKAVFRLPKGAALNPDLNESGQLGQIALDMGTIISAQPRPVYSEADWTASYNNQMPRISDREVLIEYAAHPDARFHLDGETVPVEKLSKGTKAGPLTPIAAATQRVTIRVTEKGSKKPVAVKLHVHGEAGEYLPPVDRHRIPNWAWYEDYCPEFQNREAHWCVYIAGEADLNLPTGKVFIEVSKGFEIKPIRKVVSVSQRTKQIALTVEKVLPWRERGWVTADTHVHFLSPPTANLEGAAEGVNVVNLLASQWGELMTNAGDFDGKTTFGSKEAGGDGEYLVRVGTENRQHVLGHISLIGYRGRVIAPMTTGGPDESALGDPVEILLTEWARQCHAQGGLVVIPHFPNPRAEHAAAIIEGEADALEMTAWGNLYGGIDPYSLSDWYRYLNCGYFVPAVGGTDKMSASTAVGTVRTYAHIPKGRPFTYDAWMDAVRSGHTFVSYGPLLEFLVDGKRAGQSIRLTRTGGTVDIEWEVASVTVPMSRVELIVNGAIRESKRVKPWKDSGHWRLKAEKSAWAALLVRGHYPDKPEIIAAHSSPVMIHVAGTEFFAAADALTILEQVEGALAYFDTLGTRADTAAHKRMRLVLTSAHRKLHNLLHQRGHNHAHTPATDHAEHHR